MAVNTSCTGASQITGKLVQRHHTHRHSNQDWWVLPSASPGKIYNKLQITYFRFYQSETWINRDYL